jgi:hypothetical protein
VASSSLISSDFGLAVAKKSLKKEGIFVSSSVQVYPSTAESDINKDGEILVGLIIRED